MLKGLKKGTKKQTKDTTKKKDPKPAKKAAEEEEEEAATDLVEIDYEKEKEAEPKKAAPKKVQAGKLEEKQIDTSTIKIEKKEEKKEITSWVVNAEDVSKLTQKDFVFKEVETEFASLTDDKLNKQLEEKAKEKQKFKATEPIVSGGGLKFAQLQGSESRKDPEISFVARAPTTSTSVGIPTSAINLPNFTNSNNSAGGNFAPLERSKQDIIAEQIESRRRDEPEIAVKRPAQGWLGGTKKEEKAPEFKVSAWAAKADEVSGGGMKFAPIEKSSGGSGRKEQEFVYTSKKESEERRKLQEQERAKQAAS